MRFSLTTIVSSLVLAALVSSQATKLALPANGAHVTAGQNLTVQLQRPDSLTGSTELAAAIGIRPCDKSTGTCSTAEFLGTTLFAGPYNPQFGRTPTGEVPYQNFTVQVPDGFAAGKALVSVFHYAIVGASGGPLFETHNATVTVVAAR